MITLSNSAGPIEPIQTNFLISLFGSDPNETATNIEFLKAQIKPQSIDPEIFTKSDIHFTWKINDWDKLGKSEDSPHFKAGDYTWKLNLRFQENKNSAVSLFFQVISPNTDLGQVQNILPSEWAACGQFVAVCWNPDDPRAKIIKSCNHRFTNEDSISGFQDFLKPLDLIFPIHPNGSSLFSSKGQINISVYLRILHDPTGVLWYDMNKYDSRRATGYVGLKKRTSSYYFNSLLQSLYFIPMFRESVHCIPTAEDNFSVSYALQQVFTELQNSEKPVDTYQLRKEFGDNISPAGSGSGIRDTIHKLFRNLATKEKTVVDLVIPLLFSGFFKRSSRLQTQSLEKILDDTFWSIPLKVEGFENFSESLEYYAQLKAREFGNQNMDRQSFSQNAKNTQIFLSLPLVLHFELKRDNPRDSENNVDNIYHPFEFTADIYLSSYLDQSFSTHYDLCHYTLHSVIVHSRDSGISRYHSFVKPTKDGPWYKFDDETVTRATTKQVFHDNFGGTPIIDITNPASGNNIRQRNSTVLFLVYVKKTAFDRGLSLNNVSEFFHEKYPSSIFDALVANQKVKRKKPYKKIRIASDMRQFRIHNTHGIAIFENGINIDKLRLNVGALADVFVIENFLHPTKLMDRVQNEWYPQVQPSAMRLWTISKKSHTTHSVDMPINIKKTQFLEQLKGFTTCGTDMNFFLEIEDSANIDPLYRKPILFFEGDNYSGKRILLFLKVFCPLKQSMVGVTTAILYENSKIGALVPIICKNMNWPSNTLIRIWQETDTLPIGPLDINKSAAESKLHNGSILAFEKEAPSDSIENIFRPTEFKTIPDYYAFLQNQIKITFGSNRYSIYCPTNALGDVFSWNSTHTIVVDRNSSYRDVAKLIGSHIGANPDHIQLFASHFRRQNDCLPSNLIRPLSWYFKNKLLTHIEIRFHCYPQFKNPSDRHDLFEYIWLNEAKYIHQQRYFALMPKSSTIFHLRDILPYQAGVHSSHVNTLKMWTIFNHRIEKMLDPGYQLSFLKSKNICFALETPEERNVENDARKSSIRIIEVFHFRKKVDCPHGIPFRFALIRNEPFSQTKVRLQKTLGMDDGQFSKIKFAIVSASGYQNQVNESYGHALPIYTEDANPLDTRDADYDLPSYSEAIDSHTMTELNDDRFRIEYIEDVADEQETERPECQYDYESTPTPLNNNTKLFNRMRTTDALGLDYNRKPFQESLVYLHFASIQY